MNQRIKNKPVKSLKPTVEWYAQLKKPLPVKLSSDSWKISNQPAKMVCEATEYSMIVQPVDLRIVNMGNQNETSTFVYDKSEYRILSSFITSLAIMEDRMKATIDHFRTIDLHEGSKQYYRAIIPSASSLEFRYHLQFNHDFDIKDWHPHVGWLGTIADNQTEFYEIIVDGEQLLIIESNSNLALAKFKELVFAIRNTYGYVSGSIPGNLLYIFGYKTSNHINPVSLECQGIRGFKKAYYCPVTKYPGRVGYNHYTAGKGYKKYENLTLMTADVFENIANKCFQSLEFANLIHLMIDSSTASLHSMASGYVIAFEILANLFKDQDKTTIKAENPIRKPEWKVILDELRLVISNNSELTENEIEFLNMKISGLNQVTNRDRLLIPFKFQGIELLEEDLKIIGERNELLHGRIPNNIDTDGIAETNNYLYYVALRLQTLLNTAILKWMGYSGTIVNYPKLKESTHKVKINEEYFKEI